jgi:hypothetical protein
MQVTFDAADPDRLARFWAEALPGYQLQPPPPGFDSWDAFLAANDVPPEHRNDASAIVALDSSGPRVFFQKVAEAKSAKNRVHLDLQSGGGPSVPLEEQQARIRTEVERLVALGASVVGDKAELGVAWTVMTDPEGNEFCV